MDILSFDVLLNVKDLYTFVFLFFDLILVSAFSNAETRSRLTASSSSSSSKYSSTSRLQQRSGHEGRHGTASEQMLGHATKMNIQ